MTMRALLLGVALMVAGAEQSAPSVPVLVELFTSEGCSSCPPADVLLSRLASESVPGAQVIALGLHVDYWDEQGWKDPASMREATARQSAYARALGNGDRIYTPQLVVDGRDEMIGTDAAAVKQAIAEALKHPRAGVRLTVDVDGGALVARGSVTDLPAEAAKESVEAILAVTEDDLTNVVKRGENSGRTLHHDAVVRALVSMGSLRAPGDVRQRATLKPEWRRDRLRAVVFLQGRKSQRIWGVGTAPIQ
ncbi:MAG: DUF1223 domain-containing protein [Acidobacteria bacterium]|nr:MAG: DUF1223 domain-containing protein [Acidobacteriota bacterium]